jgi:hypothetical protein
MKPIKRRKHAQAGFIGMKHFLGYQTLGQRPILHGLFNSGRELGDILFATAWAFLFFATMLNHVQLRLGDFKDLAFLEAMRSDFHKAGIAT